MSQTLLEIAKDLVLAQIEAHRLAADEMHAALQHTYATLQALKMQEESYSTQNRHPVSITPAKSACNEVIATSLRR